MYVTMYVTMSVTMYVTNYVAKRISRFQVSQDMLQQTMLHCMQTWLKCYGSELAWTDVTMAMTQPIVSPTVVSLLVPDALLAVTTVVMRVSNCFANTPQHWASILYAY